LIHINVFGEIVLLIVASAQKLTQARTGCLAALHIPED